MVIIDQFRGNHPVGAVLLFVLIYAISIIATLPSLPLNLAAGFFWGGCIGGLYSTIGVTIGGWISFASARWMIGQLLTKKFDSKWSNWVQSEFNKRSWGFVAFARINPIIPTGPLNYLLGLTSLSNKSFLATTFIFLLPPSISIAYVGDTLQTFTVQQFEISEMLRGIFVVSAAVTSLLAVKFTMIFFEKRTNK